MRNLRILKTYCKNCSLTTQTYWPATKWIWRNPGTGCWWREKCPLSSGDIENRWAVDHLFLDQDGIPTIVEVKRSTDTRIRREVVGQMLDYAANVAVHWPVEQIRAHFEAHCEAMGKEPAQELEERLGVHDEDAFWQQVRTNLQAGRLRLVFVADQIPPELRRVVEFLNRQMDPAKVLAVEVKQYVGPGLNTLVPRVYGQEGTQSQRTSSRDTGFRWDEGLSLETLSKKKTATDVDAAKKLLHWARERKLEEKWGKGPEQGGVSVRWASRPIIGLSVLGTVEFPLQYLKRYPPFDADANRLELARRLREAGIESATDIAIDRRPNCPLSLLANPERFQKVVAVLEWLIAQFKAYYTRIRGDR